MNKRAFEQKLRQWAANLGLGDKTPGFNESAAVASAVGQNVFWGHADAWSAMEALRFSARTDDLWGGPLGELWHHFVQERLRIIGHISERGLNAGAFRHPRHATNALAKLRRTGSPGSDLVDAWQEEVERRIADSARQSA